RLRGVHDVRRRRHVLMALLGAPRRRAFPYEVLGVLRADRLLPKKRPGLGEQREVMDGDHSRVALTVVDERVVVPRGAGEDVPGLAPDLLAVDGRVAAALDPVVDRDRVVPVAGDALTGVDALDPDEDQRRGTRRSVPLLVHERGEAPVCRVTLRVLAHL